MTKILAIIDPLIPYRDGTKAERQQAVRFLIASGHPELARALDTAQHIEADPELDWVRDLSDVQTPAETEAAHGEVGQPFTDPLQRMEEVAVAVANVIDDLADKFGDKSSVVHARLLDVLQSHISEHVTRDFPPNA